jgi:hypothetical protein
MLDLVIGRRELGKTTFAVYLSRQFSTRVLFDPRHMINTTSDILSDGQIGGGVLYSLLDTRSEIIVRPHFDKEATFNEMCREIYDWLRDNPEEKFCLLLDEARFIKEPEKNTYFDYIVRCTPRELVEVIFTCHGVIDISPDLRRIADFWILFRLTMESDLDRVRERCGETVAIEVQKLEPYEYIVWNDARGTWAKHTDRAKWYVSLGMPLPITKAG